MIKNDNSKLKKINSKKRKTKFQNNIKKNRKWKLRN